MCSLDAPAHDTFPGKFFTLWGFSGLYIVFAQSECFLDCCIQIPAWWKTSIQRNSFWPSFTAMTSGFVKPFLDGKWRYFFADCSCRVWVWSMFFQVCVENPKRSSSVAIKTICENLIDDIIYTPRTHHYYLMMKIWNHFEDFCHSWYILFGAHLLLPYHFLYNIPKI